MPRPKSPLGVNAEAQDTLVQRRVCPATPARTSTIHTPNVFPEPQVRLLRRRLDPLQPLLLPLELPLV